MASLNLSNINSNTRVTGTFYNGLADKPEKEKIFMKEFDAYVAPSKNTIRSVTSPHGISTDYLTVTEEEGVQINITKHNFEVLCNIIEDHFLDMKIRQTNQEAHNLYMRYKTYIELLK